jgi:hypothetical protein
MVLSGPHRAADPGALLAAPAAEEWTHRVAYQRAEGALLSRQERRYAMKANFRRRLASVPAGR